MTQEKKLTDKVKADALTHVVRHNPPRLRVTAGMRKAALAAAKNSSVKK